MTALDKQNNCAAISSKSSLKFRFSDFSNVRPQAPINFHLMSGWSVSSNNIVSTLSHVWKKK